MRRSNLTHQGTDGSNFTKQLDRSVYSSLSLSSILKTSNRKHFQSLLIYIDSITIPSNNFVLPSPSLFPKRPGSVIAFQVRRCRYFSWSGQPNCLFHLHFSARTNSSLAFPSIFSPHSSISVIALVPGIEKELPQSVKEPLVKPSVRRPEPRFERCSHLSCVAPVICFVLWPEIL